MGVYEPGLKGVLQNLPPIILQPIIHHRKGLKGQNSIPRSEGMLWREVRGAERRRGRGEFGEPHKRLQPDGDTSFICPEA